MYNKFRFSGVCNMNLKPASAQTSGSNVVTRFGSYILCACNKTKGTGRPVV